MEIIASEVITITASHYFSLPPIFISCSTVVDIILVISRKQKFYWNHSFHCTVTISNCINAAYLHCSLKQAFRLGSNFNIWLPVTQLKFSKIFLVKMSLSTLVFNKVACWSKLEFPATVVILRVIMISPLRRGKWKLAR